ncbi:MAG: dihydrolipoamide acetyltransferase family protein [Archangium sp.]|nr:dihydrolipoamide acetyltransferase family protein [Archangium sp.]MDP3152940.1 dihydrolipoamide acetyltransferase family protein [Archangium sp.]MDP3569902.1 dihydrolipoamide acetyltransferase family protein [Archangium sp.]
MALFEFQLPDIGEGVVEGEIVKWLVKPGDVVTEDQPLLEVMTDKATVTIPSPKAGTVVKTHGKEGELAKVHKPLVDLEIVGNGAPAKSSGPAPVAAKAAPVAAAAALSAPSGEKVLATPVTRRMASTHGIDLANVSGSGPQGRVLKTDVEAFMASGNNGAAKAPVAAKAWAPLASNAVDQRIPIRGLRKKIAEKMVKSKFTAPHYTFVEEVDVSALVALRTKLNDSLAKENVKLSFLPFFVKAAIAAFRKYPQVNANMDEAAQDLIVRGDFNIGIAAMTEQGLTVPVVRHADRLSLRGLGTEISRLGTAARDQRLKLEELTGGSFTITSLGQTGGLFATPIINHPEVAIMGVHKLRKRPMVTEDDQIVIKPIMLFSFAFDHRVIDGATGAEFAYELIKFIEQPELLLVDMI